MSQVHDSNGSPGGFHQQEIRTEETHYQTLTDAMTYDCGNRSQQDQNGYAMQGLIDSSSSNNYIALGQHALDMYSSGEYHHNFQNDQAYYGANSELMLSAYDGNDGPSSSGLNNIGQYFTSVMDPMMMTHHQPQHSQGGYGTNGGGLDYTDVNNLEPSLMPDTMQAPNVTTSGSPQQQTQLHQQMQQQHGGSNGGLITMMPPGGHHQQHQQQQQPIATYVTNYYNASYHSSPTGSSHTSSGTDISDEGDDLFGLSPYKRSPTGEVEYRNVKGKRQGKKRKPRKDPNEPQKPVSAYALFFRDTQAAIKGQNPNASFGEVSKIVASMWDSLGTDSKNIYKQKTESAKKEYLKQLAAYRANLLSKGNRGCMTMDPFAELAAQQRKASMQAQSTSSPDSTTSLNGPEQKDPCSEIGTKSLASLIAEPAPQQVLTATTTLTVPQSYTSARTKGDYSLDMDGNAALCIRTNACHSKPSIDEQQTHWERDYVIDDCVAKNCRDMYTGWVPARQAQQQAAGAYAPV